MTETKKPLSIYMETMLEAGFHEQWNLKGESQTYWVFQFFKEWLTQKRREIECPNLGRRKVQCQIGFVEKLLEELDK